MITICYEFSDQIDHLSRLYSFVDLKQLRRAFLGEDSLPTSSCLLTFDDGLRSQYEVAWKILNKKGIPGAFFVNTSFYETGDAETVHKIHWLLANQAPQDLRVTLREVLDPEEILVFDSPDLANRATQQYRYDTDLVSGIKYFLNFVLSSERRDFIAEHCLASDVDTRAFARSWYMERAHLCEIASSGSLGIHGHRHQPLAVLPYDQVIAQIETSRDCLEQMTGQKPFAISYPYGGPCAVSLLVRQAAKDCGMSIGITMKREVNDHSADPLMLSRLDTVDVSRGANPILPDPDQQRVCTKVMPG